MEAMYLRLTTKNMNNWISWLLQPKYFYQHVLHVFLLNIIWQFANDDLMCWGFRAMLIWQQTSIAHEAGSSTWIWHHKIWLVVWNMILIGFHDFDLTHICSEEWLNHQADMVPISSDDLLVEHTKYDRSLVDILDSLGIVVTYIIIYIYICVYIYRN